MINEVKSYLNTVTTYLNAFIANQAPAQLATASSHIDSLQAALPKFIYPSTAREMAGYSVAEEKYKKILDDYISTLEKKHEILNTAVNEVTATIQSQEVESLNSFKIFVKKMEVQQEILFTEWQNKFEEISLVIKSEQEQKLTFWQQRYENNYDSFNKTKAKK